MLKFDIKRKINTLRDILVGKVPDPKAQVEQITIAMIYKFMDDIDLDGMEFGLSGAREFFKDEFEKYAWSNIMQSENSGQQRAILFAEGIDKMAMNPHLPQLFRDIFRGAYVPYRDPDTLNMFLKEISEFSYNNSEDLGNAFEYLLSIMGSQGDAGQFRTPRHIIDMIVKIVDPKKNETVLDPACGTAGFLISAYKHILEHNKDENGKITLTADDRKRLSVNFAGYDISPDMVRLSRVNMYLHKFTKPQINEYDTLTSEEKWDDSFDVILANPPFMTPKGGIIPHNRYRVGAKRAEVLFVDYIAEHLNPTGRAGIIVPEGIVFQSANAYKQLREYLVKDNLLYAVISLPAGVFNPYSGVKTSVLLFDKTLAKQKDEILFVKMNNDGYDLGAQRREIKQNDISDIVGIVHAFQDGADVSCYPQYATLASKEEIANHDYILVGERYREAAVVNRNYDVVSLGDKELFSIESGGTPSSDISQYWNGDINWATLVDLPSTDFISHIKSTERKITVEGLKNSSAKLLPSNTILVSTRATIGRIAISETAIATNQGFKNIVILNKDKILVKYVAYMMTKLVSRMNELSSGGTFKEVSKTNFMTLQIPLPRLSIQEEIVAEIESYQKIVDGAKQVVDNYKPTMKFDPEWEIVKLSDIIEFNPPKSEVKYLDIATQVSFVPMATVNENSMSFIPQEKRTLEEVYSGYTFFKENDVLLAKVTPCFENGKAGIAKNLVNGIGFGSSEFFVLRAKPCVLPELLYFFVHSTNFINEGRSNMSGTGGLQRLVKDFVLNYSVALPSLEVQQQIVKNINEEMAIVEQNKRMIIIFEQKIKDKIKEVWGE